MKCIKSPRCTFFSDALEADDRYRTSRIRIPAPPASAPGVRLRAEVSFTETISTTVTFASERFEEGHGGPFTSVEEFQEYLQEHASDLWSEPEVSESNRHDWDVVDDDLTVQQVVPEKGDPAPVRRTDAVDAYRLHRARPNDDFELLNFGDGRWGLYWAPFRPITVRTSPEAVLEVVATAGTPEYVYLAAQLQNRQTARRLRAAVLGETA